MELCHQHLLYQAKVGNDELDKDSREILEKFLYELVDIFDMECLIQPQLEFSHEKAWTGLIGIVTSHIAFHFWAIERYVQLDIYSCKEFDNYKAIKFLNEFWKAQNVNALCIDRKMDSNFKIKDFSE